MRTFLGVLVLLVPFSFQPPSQRGSSALIPGPTGTAVIRGRVIAGDTSAGMPFVAVTLIGDPPRLLRFVLTDRTGAFEFTNVPSGSFRLSAQPPQYFRRYLSTTAGSEDPAKRPDAFPVAAGQIVERVQLVMPVASAISGRILDEDGFPLAGANVTATQVGPRGGVLRSFGASTDDVGAFRLAGLSAGDYILDARMQTDSQTLFGGTAFGDLENPPGFARTYYAGTLTKSDATPVHVGRARDISGIELHLARTRVFSINGLVVDSHGRTPSSAMLSFETDSSSNGSSLSADGRFTERGLLPGDYWIRVAPNMSVDDPAGGREFAAVRITIADSDVDNLIIATHPGVDVTGRVSFAQGTPSPVPTIDVSPQTPTRDRGFRARTAKVQPDLSFTVRDLFGPVVIRPHGVPSGWWLKTVLLGATDITDTPTEFRPGDCGRLQIVLTSRASGLDGVVTDDRGQRVTRATVVLFSPDPADWIVESSRVRYSSIARDGRFGLAGIRPGRYLIVAVDPIAYSELNQNPRPVLERLLKIASPIYVGDDEQRTIDLQLAKIPEDAK